MASSSALSSALMPAEKRRKDYASWRLFNDKPRDIPGCPGTHACKHAQPVMHTRQTEEKRNATPFGVNLMKSQVLFWAAQGIQDSPYATIPCHCVMTHNVTPQWNNWHNMLQVIGLSVMIMHSPGCWLLSKKYNAPSCASGAGSRFEPSA